MKSDGHKQTFEHKDGDAYAMMIAERMAMPIDAMRMAIANAEKVAPDTQVTYEETRISATGKRYFV